VRDIKSSGSTLTGARSDAKNLSTLNSQISCAGLPMNQETEVWRQILWNLRMVAFSWYLG
jgi:hypothetical protein